jgi:hypothetical protein
MAQFANSTTAKETSLEGCPDPTAGRAVIVPAGHVGNVCHQLRDDEGAPIDVLTYLGDLEGVVPLDPPATHIVYVADALCTSEPVYQAVGTIDPDGDPSVICFEVPSNVTDRPGIYKVELAVLSADGVTQITDSTLLSVEPSLAYRAAGGQYNRGPITINEVRLQMRDFPVLNSYWQNVEFSDTEIVHSILEPIRCFNETLPRAMSFGPTNFPYRHHWLQAVCAALLRISAVSYMRNSRRIAYGDGKTTDDRDKYATYSQLAEAKWQEYKMFCTEQQVTANWTGATRVGGIVMG